MLGTVVFLFLAPGTVAGLLPRWITGWRMPPMPSWWVVAQAVGVTLVAAGLMGLVAEFTRFALQGIGTPAPVAPTRHLVVHGLYRYVRNPMYLCVDAVVLGQVVLFASLPLLVYAVVAALVMAAFAHWYEEPALAARFGAEYERYRRRVPGWVPRPRSGS
jgi:protein-S-isoprenylcysteine O-methyltransferase Ste14